MGQFAQNRIGMPALLAVACLYLSSARADTIARPDGNLGLGKSLEFRHLTTPQPGNGTTDPTDDGTSSNHPNQTHGGANGSGTLRAALIAGSKVTGMPPEIPWLWLIVTGALSFAALGMGGHIILREEPA